MDQKSIATDNVHRWDFPETCRFVFQATCHRVDNSPRSTEVAAAGQSVAQLSITMQDGNSVSVAQSHQRGQCSLIVSKIGSGIRPATPSNSSNEANSMCETGIHLLIQCSSNLCYSAKKFYCEYWFARNMQQTSRQCVHVSFPHCSCFSAMNVELIESKNVWESRDDKRCRKNDHVENDTSLANDY